MFEDQRQEVNEGKDKIVKESKPPVNFIDAKVKSSSGSNPLQVVSEASRPSIDIIQDEMTLHDFNTDQSLMIPVNSSIDPKMLTSTDMHLSVKSP